MPSYCSFLIVNQSHGQLVESLGTPEWRLRLHPAPSKRFWFGEGGWYSVEHPSAIGKQPQTMAAPGQLVIVDADEAHHAHNIIVQLNWGAAKKGRYSASTGKVASSLRVTTRTPKAPISAGTKCYGATIADGRALSK